MIEEFDKDELKAQAEDILALISNLRPLPNARPLSRAKAKLLAALSGDKHLLDLAHNATTNTLFWETDEGEIIEQEVTLSEISIG